MIYMDLTMESEASTSNNGDVKGYKFSEGRMGIPWGKKKEVGAPAFGPKGFLKRPRVYGDCIPTLDGHCNLQWC